MASAWRQVAAEHEAKLTRSRTRQPQTETEKGSAGRSAFPQEYRCAGKLLPTPRQVKWAWNVIHSTRHGYKWRIASAITGREQDNEHRPLVPERPVVRPPSKFWGDNRHASIFFHNPGNERESEHDRIGKVLPDITAALAHAEGMIGELQKQGAYDDPELKMLVKDQLQQTVLFLPFVACGD